MAPDSPEALPVLNEGGEDVQGDRLRNAQGEPPTPRPQRKSSVTARRQTQLAEAVKLLSDLQADLEGVVSGWGEGFAETGRYKRFDEASQSLQDIVVLLEDLDIGWG